MVKIFDYEYLCDESSLWAELESTLGDVRFGLYDTQLLLVQVRIFA